MEPPAKFLEEMNKIREENARFKNKIAELEKEVKTLTKIQKNQSDALIGANKANKQPYINALEGENNKMKKEKYTLKQLFDRAIKDQIKLHD